MKCNVKDDKGDKNNARPKKLSDEEKAQLIGGYTCGFVNFLCNSIYGITSGEVKLERYGVRLGLKDFSIFDMAVQYTIGEEYVLTGASKDDPLEFTAEELCYLIPEHCGVAFEGDRDVETSMTLEDLVSYHKIDKREYSLINLSYCWQAWQSGREAIYQYDED